MKRKETTVATTSSATYLYLPDECWEHVFKFIINNDNKNCHYFESLSLVSKQFLSMTNRFRFSLTIGKKTQPFLSHLFKRFTNLTSLNLTRYSGHLHALLRQISHFPINLTSLNLSHQSKIPLKGLRDFSKKITTLKSLTCSNIATIYSNDIFIIVDCFPLLEELDISYPNMFKYLYNGLKTFSFPNCKLRKVNLSCNPFIYDQYIFNLFKNCEFLEEVIMFGCCRITDKGIASALRERPTLKSLSFFSYFGALVCSDFSDLLVSLKGLTCLDLSNLTISNQLLSSIAMEGLPLRRLILQNCTGYSYEEVFSLLSKCRHIQHLNLQEADFLNDDGVAELSFFLDDLVFINLSKCSKIGMLALLALVKNCISLSEIKMENTYKEWENSFENSKSLMDCVVNHQLKSLSLAHNSFKDKSIIILASIFPNLQLLDLSHCSGVFDDDIVQLLKSCCKIRHLNLTNCSGLRLHGMNFEASMLEVLDLSLTRVDDKTLDVISKNCCGLLRLLLEHCAYVTEKGVKHVVENCTQLREINLWQCNEVHANIVDWMVFSRPSLRKIIAPPSFCLSDQKRKHFLCQGCLVCKHPNRALSKF